MNELRKCIEFIRINGWKIDKNIDTEYKSFYKDCNISIDINQDEIVFISDIGDFLHIPINYYALIGAMLEFKIIGIDYKSIK